MTTPNLLDIKVKVKSPFPHKTVIDKPKTTYELLQTFTYNGLQQYTYSKIQGGL